MRRFFVWAFLCVLAVSTAAAQSLVVDKDVYSPNQLPPVIAVNGFTMISGLSFLLPGTSLFLVTSPVCDANQIVFGQVPNSGSTEPTENKQNKLLVKKFDELDISPYHDLTAKGIVAEWRKHTLTADKVTGNTEKHEYQFDGDVFVTSEGLSLKAKQYQLNTQYRSWVSSGFSGWASPRYLDTAMLKQNLIMSGADMTGTQKTAHMTDCILTTCDREHPHYEIDADTADFVKGKSLTLTDLRLRMWNRTLFKIPKLVIPLDREYDPEYIPEVGNSVDEGYFVKMAMGYALIQQQGKLRLQLMQKKGVGLGVEQPYEFGQNKGTMQVFGLLNQTQGSRYITASLNNTSKLLGMEANFAGDLRSNSYMLGNDSSSSMNLTLSQNTSGGSFNSNSRYESQDSSYYNSDTFSEALSYGYRWGRQSIRVSSDYSQTSSSYNGANATTTERLTGGIDGSGVIGSVDWGLTVNRYFDVGADQNSIMYGGLEKLPELSIKSDGYRLWKKDNDLSLSTILGRYAQMPDGDTINRALFEASWNPRWNDRNGIKFTGSSLFRQIFSSDNSAQYVLQTSIGVNKQIVDGLSWRANYQYCRPYGYSPLSLDYTGKSSYASVGVEYNKSEMLKIRVGSGYDFFAELQHSNPWRMLNLEAMVKPSPTAQIALTSSIDPNSGRWDNLRSIVRYSDKTVSANFSALYDPKTDKLASGNAYLETYLFNNGWRIGGLLNYNGYTDQFDSQQYQIIRDMHCMEAVFSMSDIQTGYSVGKQFMLQLRLKALGKTPKLGRGNSGESLMSSSGGYSY